MGLHRKAVAGYPVVGGMGVSWTPKRILTGVGVLVGGAVAIDLGRSIASSTHPAPAPPPIQQVYPSTDPEQYAVRLTGDRKTRWLKQEPHAIGDSAPPLKLAGEGGQEFRLPSPEGKPSVLLLTSASRKSTPLVAPIRDFYQLYGQQAQIAIAVLNTEPASWEQHTNNLGKGKTSIVLFWDKTGEVLEKLRPEAADPEELPAVWGFDGQGKVRYFAQPTGVGGSWRDDLRAALGIPKAQEDLAVGTRAGDAPGPAHPE